jgi:5'(3')-deoxyribonucleotidase
MDYKDITILIDVDDTIENLCESWCEFINRKYGTSVTYKDVTEWDISKFFPTLTKEQVFEPLHNEELWQYVKPKPGAVEYIKKLMDDGFTVYLCTSTDYRNVKVKFEQVIQKYFPYISWKQMIVTDKKQIIKADFLVDDGVHNLEKGDYVKILMSAPHNANYNAEENEMFRADNWETVYSLIKTISQHIYKKRKYWLRSEFI